MDLKRQASAPLYEAIEKFRKKRIVPFDVPGHKRGRGNPELVDLLGERCVGIDVNSMKPLDNLCHPVSVIKEAEELTAEAFGAEHAFFMVGGTTQAVQNMVLSVCKAGDEIIVPRNVHKSVINALILCGAIPVYLNTEINAKLGIVLGVTVQQVEKTIQEHPNAVAVLVNNPTYYGICSDIKGICDIAHAYGLKVLADEAHGTHLYFGDNLPMNSMKAGADIAAISMHKSGGSLTQSSILLTNNGMNADYVQTIINITQTTSASYLLMTSLDISRRNLALRGRQSFAKVSEWAQYARDEINMVGGYYAYGKELINGGTVYDYDVTKLCVYTRDIGLDGIEVYDILRDEYDIQIEFGDIGNIMAYISIGDRIQDIERLVGALAEISRLYSKEEKRFEVDRQMLLPRVLASPQEAFYADKIKVPIREAAGHISGEFVMAYPPGIPILAPGEEITDEIIDYIQYARDEINMVGGYYAYGKELINGGTVYDYDVTKLCVYTRDIGLDGIEVYDILRDEYDIQIEFGDIGNIMAYISIGDRIQDIERLVGALAEISRLYSKEEKRFEVDRQMLLPRVLASPQEAFYADKIKVPIREAAGHISGEFVMAYPPGIPILAPGEEITDEIIDYIQYSVEKGCSMQGMEDSTLQTLNVLRM